MFSGTTSRQTIKTVNNVIAVSQTGINNLHFALTDADFHMVHKRSNNWEQPVDVWKNFSCTATQACHSAEICSHFLRGFPPLNFDSVTSLSRGQNGCPLSTMETSQIDILFSILLESHVVQWKIMSEEQIWRFTEIRTASLEVCKHGCKK